MRQDELSGPDLDGVVADANAVGLPYVVIGGFSVIAHGYLRATKDSDLLVPDGPDADEAILRFLERIEARRLSDGEALTPEDVTDAHHLRVNSRHGIVDLMRGGLPPLDFDTVAEGAVEVDVGDEPAPFASLRSIVGFKRLANRGQDRLDLEALEQCSVLLAREVLVELRPVAAAALEDRPHRGGPVAELADGAQRRLHRRFAQRLLGVGGAGIGRDGQQLGGCHARLLSHCL